MKKLLRTLFGVDRTDHPPRADNVVAVNQVLARYRNTPSRPVAVADVTPDPAERRLEFDLGGLSMEEPKDASFNPYDTGRFSTAELWEKRHRNRLT